MDIFTYIIMGLLSLDTIRAILAMTGWIKPEFKYSWIIYGRYERNLIKMALKDMGFSENKTCYIYKKLEDVSKQISSTVGVSEENAVKHLIALLAKYIIKFDKPIQYGGKRTTTSYYYIDTMEISHVPKDKRVLSAIMHCLYSKKNCDTKKPEVIVTPKGGNPFLAMSVSELYDASCLVAKSENDKSRISSVDNNSKEDFTVNYEGAWSTENKNLSKCIIMDCNISGGSQLLNIAKDMQIFKDKQAIKFPPPKEIFVLFCADEQGKDIDKNFMDFGCQLYRFFDLDEDLKSTLYKLKKMCESKRIDIDIYIDEVSAKIDDILGELSKKNKLYF